MALVEDLGNSFKENDVFIDEYLPIDLHEEEVSSIPLRDELSQTSVNGGIEQTSDSDSRTRAKQDLENGLIKAVEAVSSELLDGSGSLSGDKLQLKTHACYHCPKHFTTHDKMLRHIKMYHKENVQVRVDQNGRRSWVCGRCNKTFISRKGSIIHQRTHTGERPYSCYTCGKRFIDGSTLMKHQVIHQEVRPFTCQICSRGFNQKVALQRHERTHTQQSLYTCRHCPKTFLVTSSLHAHEKIHSGIKPFTCQYCPSTFHTSTAQRQHERVHTNERPYSCIHCPKAFKDSGTLFKHQVIHSGIKPFICPLCSKGFTQKIALKKHIRSHVMRSNVNSCDFCHFKFDKTLAKEEIALHIEEHIEQHSRLRSEAKSLATSSSVNTFGSEDHNSVDSVSKHQVFYSSVEHFVCPFCSKDFKLKITVKKHIRTSHVMRFNVNSCDFCNSRFDKSLTKEEIALHFEEHIEHSRLRSEVKSLAMSSVNSFGPEDRNSVDAVIISSNNSRINSADGFKPSCDAWNPSSGLSDLATLCDVAVSAAREEITRKTNDKEYLCSECGLGFKQENLLKIHLQSHNSLVCQNCDKIFMDRKLMEKHRRLFCNYRAGSNNVQKKRMSKMKSVKLKTNKRQFSCEKCGKQFSSRNGYMIHQRSHSGERPYGCRWCEKAFRDSATRHKHERIHTGERPFKCIHCPRAFNQRAALRAHQVTHSIIRAYVCEYCPSSFPYDATLRRHYESCHGAVPRQENTSNNQ